ncbi:MAG: sodium:proton antiporter, partial [Bacteroidota bacterium]
MMRYLLTCCTLLFCMYVSPSGLIAQHNSDTTDHSTETPHETEESGHTDPSDSHADEAHMDHSDHGEHGHGDHASPAAWSTIPFIVLLLLIATGPVFFEHFWHHNYKYIAPALGLITLLYYLFVLHDSTHPSHALSEYVSFIALLAPLYIASGGILIQIDREGTPLVNVMLLLFGAVISNIIGTTGASMLLIRPFIRLNRDRLQPYHIVFFIFIVSNVGGSLTPIGDPPLFLGFLKGVPFEWTLIHVVPEWLFGILMLAGIFYFYDIRNKKDLDQEESVYSGKFILRGTKNFIWLAIIIGA